MNDSAAPWRVLEDPAVAGGAPAEAPTGTEPGDRLRLPTLGWQTGALVMAAILTTIAILLVLTGGRGSVTVTGGGHAAIESGLPRAGGSAAPLASASVLVVDVQGAVARPGIVRLPPGSRVADAIASAGGYGTRVAAERVAERLNLAALVRDGDQVVVPSRDDPSATSRAPGGASGSASSGGQPGATIVELNSATASELDALPGIGPVTAQKILAAREEQPFASVDDLRTRKVVGAATLDKIKELVTVR